jgi:hypothetical protein
MWHDTLSWRLGHSPRWKGRCDVTPVKPGQFVIGSFFASDNTCPNCRAGYQTSCHTREQFLFRRDTSVLNRFAALLAIAVAADPGGATRVEVHIGKTFKTEPYQGSVRFNEDPKTLKPHYRFLRFGADEDTNLLPFRDLKIDFDKSS